MSMLELRLVSGAVVEDDLDDFENAEDFIDWLLTTNPRSWIGTWMGWVRTDQVIGVNDV